jgi:hypothetical protein
MAGNNGELESENARFILKNATFGLILAEIMALHARVAVY